MSRIYLYILPCVLIYSRCVTANTPTRKLYYTALNKAITPEVCFQIGVELDKIIDKFDPDLKKYHTKEHAAEALLNMKYSEAVKVKKILEKSNKSTARSLHVRNLGYLCDRRFCGIMGAGHHSMGICSPYSCSCIKNNPHPGKCGMHRVFNPIVGHCDYVENVSICGSKLTQFKW